MTVVVLCSYVHERMSRVVISVLDLSVTITMGGAGGIRRRCYKSLDPHHQFFSALVAALLSFLVVLSFPSLLSAWCSAWCCLSQSAVNLDARRQAADSDSVINGSRVLVS